MKPLTDAIFAKLSGSTLATLIGDRLFKGEAPAGTPFPYVVFFVVSDYPEYPGGKTIERVLLQFSIFSAASGPSEAESILSALRTLYDDVVLTITGYTSIFFIRGNLTTMRDEVTSNGTVGVWHYAQEYEIQIVK